MDLPDKRYIVGIDLGTTNSAVSYVDLSQEAGPRESIRLFKIPQLTGPGEVRPLPVLPSFLYIPGEYDISKDVLAEPWEKGEKKENRFVGAFARDHGGKVPARLVSSAKSWLCHPGVDRRARILPWGAPSEVSKVSPVTATASYLSHVRNTWNSLRGEDESLHLENQMVILCVPASFDEIARDLTLEAAAEAGLRNVTLLEEPLAAFYSWLIRHETRWREFVRPNELILVCDVGGGTTDFTLITLKEIDGSPRFERIAVGDHLILGGDNVDLALARRIEAKLGKNRPPLGGDRWKTLCHLCREAKESLLQGEGETRRITLMGGGSRLIEGTVASELSREEVEETVLNGFFPLVDAEAPAARSIRKGITELGLPYEPEPAITRHLGWFLDRHRQDVSRVLGRENHAPDLILFNGGALKPEKIRERIRAAVRHWFRIESPELPRALENPEPDLAVALGAAYYGLVRTGRGVRVGSGSARGYYLRVETAAGAETDTGTRHAICLVERGLEEGSDISIPDKRFEIVANRQIGFEMYSSSFRSGDKCGDLVVIDDTLTPLPPIRTVVQFGKKGAETRIPVGIEARFSEMGTLAIWCRSLVSPHRWRLQFQLRESAGREAVGEGEIFEASLVEEACTIAREAFSEKRGEGSFETLVKSISDRVERPRERWPLGLIRPIADELLKQIVAKRLSAAHESRWLNLAGFCLRPGFGDGLDDHRIKQVWKLFKGGPEFGKNPQVRAEWWIFWRRVAGGLNPGQQRQFIQELGPAMMPKKGEKVRIPPQERIEIWMTVGNLERLYPSDKLTWGRRLLSELGPKNAKPQLLWALSRIGARELLYGPLDRVIPPEETAAWIETLMSTPWRNPLPIGQALSRLARKTGDRARDLDETLIDRALDWMEKNGIPGPARKYLQTVVPMERQEESAAFGESLPSGLVLRNETETMKTS